MKRISLAFTLSCSAMAVAADFNTMSASCIGLDNLGMKRCLDIIARHAFGALPNMRPFTLAEKTAIDAILASDPKAVVVLLPDGSFAIGQPVIDRVIGIPCESNPCPSH